MGLVSRSGSVVTLVGAVLGYRSIIRLGKAGVGGVNTTIVKSRVIASSYKVGKIMLDVAVDEASSKALREADNDKLAGYVGSFLVVLGTLIWGYGDLVGHL